MGSQLSWESICLTSRGSQVRALYSPPICCIKQPKTLLDIVFQAILPPTTPTIKGQNKLFFSRLTGLSVSLFVCACRRLVFPRAPFPFKRYVIPTADGFVEKCSKSIPSLQFTSTLPQNVLTSGKAKRQLYHLPTLPQHDHDSTNGDTSACF